MQLNELDNELDLFEMANVRPCRTGLRMVIYISPRFPKIKHGPRIKVSKHYGDSVSDDFFSISFNQKREITIIHSDTGDIKSDDVNKAVEFVKMNLQVLLDLWFDKIDATDAVASFKKIL